MDRDDIDDLLDDLDAQNSDTNDSDLSMRCSVNHLLSLAIMASTIAYSMMEVNMLKQRTGTPDT